MKFFSYESRVSQLLMKLCYCCYLNLLWFICSLPIVTLGASTAALYTACFKIHQEAEGRSVGMLFFRAFKENFKQATILWLIMLGVGIVLGLDGYILYHLRASASGTPAIFWTLNLAVLIAAAVAYVIVLLYVFPLTAKVENTVWAMLKNSLLIGTHYLFATITVFGVHFAMFFVAVRFFTPILMLGEGFCAMISAWLLANVIAACTYDPEDETEEQTDAEAEQKEDAER